MKHSHFLAPCSGCAFSRRQFLQGCAACLAATSLLPTSNWAHAAQARTKKRIHLIFAMHAEKQPGPDWPNKGFDFAPVMENYKTELARRCGDLDFVSSCATGEEQAKQILVRDASENIDGYVVFQMNCWNRVVQTIATAGKPVVYTDFEYGGSGGFLTYTAAFLRNQVPHVGFVSSSQMSDLAAAVNGLASVGESSSTVPFAATTQRLRMKRTHKPGNLAVTKDQVASPPTRDAVSALKESKVLAVRGLESGPAGSILGIPIMHVPFTELNEAWKAADRDEARAVSERWQSGAESVSGVSRETLDQSAAMYLAEKAVMKKHGANAISINCLGGFYGGHIHAYPCLGFHQLLNDGLVGGCECDVRSAAALVALNILSGGRPGYISDPVIDTAKRQIIYAHCVASNRPFGPTGMPNRYEIMTHSEDRQGASVRSFLPLGYLTTTVQVSPERQEILLHRGKTVANDPDDRACRTKLCVEPLGDFEKLFTQWDRWGWHRVTVYGDVRTPVYSLAEALGWKVVEEA